MLTLRGSLVILVSSLQLVPLRALLPSITNLDSQAILQELLQDCSLLCLQMTLRRALLPSIPNLDSQIAQYGRVRSRGSPAVPGQKLSVQARLADVSSTAGHSGSQEAGPGGELHAEELGEGTPGRARGDKCGLLVRAAWLPDCTLWRMSEPGRA